MADIANDKWINIDEAAEYLGVKPGTIRDWIRKDKGIPAHKIGKQWKFKCSELDSVYMRLSQNSQPNSDTPDMNSRKER